MEKRNLVFRAHAVRRMFKRKIGVDEVRHVLRTGRTIESYPDDGPYPSRLILGWSGNRPIHIVAANNDGDDEIIIVTVYEPEPILWEPDFQRRKQR